MAGDKEDEIHRRVSQALTIPSSTRGRSPALTKVYSDNLAMFFLMGLRPERYRDNQAGITLQGPTQINITIKGDSSLPSTAQDLIPVTLKKDEQD